MRQRDRATLGPFTWTDFIALGEDDRRELVDGALMEIDVPTRTHERIVAALIGILTPWSWSRGAGEVLGSGYKLRVHERRGVMPDVQLYRRGNLPQGQEQGLERGRPDLVIEVLSPTSKSRDRIQKLHDYASLGVPEYWIVDPEERSLERLVLRQGTYSIVEALQGRAVFRPDEFEGLEIDLARLWPQAVEAEEA